MKKINLLALVTSAFLMGQLVAMDQPPKPWKPLPAIPSKPLPPVPGKQPVPTTATSAQSMPTYFQPIPPMPVTAATESGVVSEVKLTDAQEHSIQKIEEDIKKLMENNVSIAKHGIELGKSASSASILTIGKESAIIVSKLGSSSVLVANIYKHVERLSSANAEVQEVAKRRILAIVNSDEFKASETQLVKLAADDSLPTIVREPLRKLAKQIAELPGLIVTKYLNKQQALMAK